MDFKKEFQALIIPIIKGLPIIIVLVVIALALAHRSVRYLNPEFQAKGTIKVDNRDYGVESFNLFDRTGGGAPKIMANDLSSEIEILKSKSLLTKVFDKLDFDVDYFRVGQVKTMEMYHQSPFLIDYEAKAGDFYDKKFYLKYNGEHEFLFGKEEGFYSDSISSNEAFVKGEMAFQIKMDTSLLAKKPNVLQVGDIFQFRINSKKELVDNINGKNLFIKPIDDDSPLIKIYYNHEVPAKTQKLVTALMETYIEDSRLSKENHADQTLFYVDQQIATVEGKLKNSEGSLADFKTKTGIVDARQETDSKLKERLEMDIQKVGLDMQGAELQRLYNFLASGNSLQDFAPNFESLKDPIFRDSYIKTQTLELQKEDLSIIYTDSSDEIKGVENKIKILRTYLNESVGNTLQNIEIKKKSLSNAIGNVNTDIHEIPDKQRKLIVMEREVKLNEQMYNYLMEKRMELAIAKSSDKTFHKVIDYPALPEKPISPNKALIYGLALFLALVLGIALAFLLNFFRATVKNKEEIEAYIGIPALATVSRVKKNDLYSTQAFDNIYTNLKIALGKKNLAEGSASIITVSSLLPREGKSFISSNLAKTLCEAGQKVLLIDFDVRNPNAHKYLKISNETGIANILKEEVHIQDAIQKTSFKNLSLLSAGEFNIRCTTQLLAGLSGQLLETLRQQYDHIIFDTPPMGLTVDAVPVMHQSDVNLFVVRSKHSKVRNMGNSRKLLEEFQIPNINLVINGEIPNGKKYYAYYKNYYNESTQTGDFILGIN